MKYTITSASKSGEYNDNYGKKFKYLLVLQDESGQTKAATLNQKPETPAPVTNSEIEGTIEETQYGPVFKKAQAGSFSGKSFGKSPEERASIERQNALTNAVNYCSAKAQLLPKEKALEELTGKHIIEVAFYFQKFTSGAMNVASTVERASEDKIEATETVDADEIPNEVLEENYDAQV